ncbi:unnamed protein product [Rotaria magnacalcarata]|uniref:Uncharacterized protein n=5 Tax=Rotaria magnacalcarata TaxID=392030 RepID=A0A816LXL5_9BILA|nr:unnamed protein product [Rotaria magnacalcarata]CAF3950904.1 unnamed protein product [Rotaria magnacalcarata]
MYTPQDIDLTGRSTRQSSTTNAATAVMPPVQELTGRSTPSKRDEAEPRVQQLTGRSTPSKRDESEPQVQELTGRSTPSKCDESEPQVQQLTGRSTPSKSDEAEPRVQELTGRSTMSKRDEAEPPVEKLTGRTTMSKRGETKRTLYDAGQKVRVELRRIEHFRGDRGLVKQTSNNQKKPLAESIANESTEMLISDAQTTNTATSSSYVEEAKVCQSSSSSTVVTNDTISEEHLLQTFVLIWLKSNIDESDDIFRSYMTHLRYVVNNVNMFTDPMKCVKFLSQIKNDKVLMIVSDDQCELIIPEVHDMAQMDSIYLFSRSTTPCKQLANGWSKVKGVFTDIVLLCKSLKQNVDLFENDSVSISIVSADTTSKQNIDELDVSFMYTQLLKEILLEISYDEKSFKDFITYCRKLYAKDFKTLETIAMFEREYCPTKALWWYTYEGFLYRMLNKALRNLEINNLIKLGFFIRDLHQQLQFVYEKQFGHTQVESFTVYRGQSVCNADFEKILKTSNGLISFNNFLSTSEDEKVSLTFGKNGACKPGFVGILFEMTIDKSITSSPFALLDEYSYFQGTEKEILFSTHTVFRIKEIKPIEAVNLRWRVVLTLTQDNDPQLNAVTQCMRKETEGSTGWHRLGILLVKVGEYSKAEDVYKVLLNQTTLDELEKAHLNHQLGLTKRKQGNYEEALAYYEIAQTIREKILPENHLDLVSSYNHVGDVYEAMGNYPKALSHYEKAIEICEKTLPLNYAQLSSCNNNIGDLYNDMTEYLKALFYYKKALEMRQESLPPNHPDLATSNNNIGDVYTNIGEYTQALPYYKRVLEISRKTLPPNHPDFATFYNNIGLAYDSMGEYLQALSYYERALENSKHSLSEDHPNLVNFYSNIGLVYFNMGNFSKALQYCQNALELCKKSLPENHPILATSYNNIGMVYLKRGEYSEALSYYEKDLEISSKNLPPNHLDLGPTYNSLGHLYFNTGQYLKALSYFEQAFVICETGLPSNHPILAKCYSNIGNVYSSMGEYPKALSYFEKALEIREKSIPRNLPNLAASYSDIGLLYNRMNEYEKALLYYEQAVESAQRSLPEDHPELLMYKKNTEAIKNR